ncbi:MAG: dihydroorotate dehydrogenase [Phycisphaerales bacterium]|nr:MAG: dihydroorotate dehydrogenase [Phycisphaerales bacterium]
MVSTGPAAAPVDLSVDFAGLHLVNPVTTASGTCGYGAELAEYLDLRQLGGFVTKAVTREPRKGNPPVRTVETGGGMLNAIGLANVGLERFLVEKIPYLRTAPTTVIVNVAGHRVEDYAAVCERLDGESCVAALELNVSCPNVAEGLEFGTDPVRLAQLVRVVREAVSRAKLIVKLSPNVTDITAVARAAIDAGADALSMINTLTGMAIHAETRRPILANVTGGLSGPAIKPVALAMIHAVYRSVAGPAGVPILGSGGICTWRDAVEFMLAGATAVSIGTALFIDPTAPQRVVSGLEDYLRRHRMTSVRELIGGLQV